MKSQEAYQTLQPSVVLQQLHSGRKLHSQSLARNLAAASLLPSCHSNSGSKASPAYLETRGSSDPGTFMRQVTWPLKHAPSQHSRVLAGDSMTRSCTEQADASHFPLPPVRSSKKSITTQRPCSCPPAWTGILVILGTTGSGCSVFTRGSNR